MTLSEMLAFKLTFNIAVLGQAMTKAGIDCANVFYSGKNKNKNAFLVSYDGKIEKDLLCKNIRVHTTNQKEEYSIVDRITDFDSLLESVTEGALKAAGHNMWQNDGGSEGEFQITSDGQITLDHRKNIVTITVERSSTSLSIGEDGNLTVMPIALKEQDTSDDEVEQLAAPAPG